jgi:hypothetical protein
VEPELPNLEKEGSTASTVQVEESAAAEVGSSEEKPVDVPCEEMEVDGEPEKLDSQGKIRE